MRFQSLAEATRALALLSDSAEMREKHWLGVNNVPQTSPWPTAYISLAFVVPCSMPHKLTGHEQDVLATLVQHMRNPLDEFDMEVGDHIERIVREGNYKKMHAGRYRAALKAQGSALG